MRKRTKKKRRDRDAEEKAEEVMDCDMKEEKDRDAEENDCVDVPIYAHEHSLSFFFAPTSCFTCDNCNVGQPMHAVFVWLSILP